MGMDVYGKAATSEAGEYFRQSVWGWHPLWDYCEVVAPEITAKVKYAHSNDGDGLDADASVQLAKHLTEALETGHAAIYTWLESERLFHMPDEECALCRGRGVRPSDSHGEWTEQQEMVWADLRGHTRKGWCNGCSGYGWVRPHATHYDTSVEEVTEWRDFLLECGGFEIR